MPETFNLVEYLAYLLQRWRIWTAACATAGVLALGVSLLLPKQYTATASILIEAPAGADPRSATAVSPIYLESLKTYEQFAESQTLFLEASKKFHLADESASIAGLQRRVLKVGMPRDTKILQVSATLGDPVKAQALAQYIAQRTTELTAALGRQSDLEQTEEAGRQRDAALAALRSAQKALDEDSAREPYQAIQDRVDTLVDLRERLNRQASDAQVDAADYDARGNRDEAAAARARAAALQTQMAGVDRELERDERSAAERRTRREALSEAVSAARTAAQAAENRLNETRALSGGHNERLRVIDPGIVPERPSSPRVRLNTLAAVFIAAVFAWLYLTAAFNLRGMPRRAVIRTYSAER